MKCLVRYGALIQKDNDGYTPIDIARQRGLKDACTFFDTYPVCFNIIILIDKYISTY